MARLPRLPGWSRWVRIRDPRWRCDGVIAVDRNTLVPIGVEDDVDVYAHIRGRCGEWVRDKSVRGQLSDPWGNAQAALEKARGPGRYLILETGDQSRLLFFASFFWGAFVALGVFLLIAGWGRRPPPA